MLVSDGFSTCIAQSNLPVQTCCDLFQVLHTCLAHLCGKHLLGLTNNVQL